MRILFALSALCLLSAATVNRPLTVEMCDEMPVPFVIPATVATDSEIATFLAIRSESYCLQSGQGTAWCACFNAGLIRD